MTDIKKGTLVWAWNGLRSKMYQATYLCYDDISEGSRYRHIVVGLKKKERVSFINAKPICETKHKLKDIISDAENKIHEINIKFEEAKKNLLSKS